jgi:hypothetical protein
MPALLHPVEAHVDHLVEALAAVAAVVVVAIKIRALFI